MIFYIKPNIDVNANVYNTIQYTLLAVNIYMCVATNVGVAGDTIHTIYIITYYTEGQIDTYFTLKHLYSIYDG
jgi:hypothetical protein